MKASRQQQQQQRGCKSLCCSCRFSVSSSEEANSSNSDQFAPISSLAHAMVQNRLDEMIRERQVVERQRQTRNKQRCDQETKFIVMVAMEKCSYDPREDFRESMVEMIMANKIEETKELRSLLNYYLSMNSKEYHGVILEVFYEGFFEMEDGWFEELGMFIDFLGKLKIKIDFMGMIFKIVDQSMNHGLRYMGGEGAVVELIPGGGGAEVGLILGEEDMGGYLVMMVSVRMEQRRR